MDQKLSELSASAHNLGKFLKDNESKVHFDDLASFDKSDIKIDKPRARACSCCFKQLGQVPPNLLKKSALLLTDSKLGEFNPGL